MMSGKGWKVPAGREGFTMIEVLVATAILTMIVMMMGSLFQQTSMAWRVGSKRAEGFMQVRSFIGALQRDASQAVDAEGEKALRRKVKPSDSLGLDQSFNSGQLQFVTLSGKDRSLCRVTYSSSGTRKVEELNTGGGWKVIEAANDVKQFLDSGSGNTPTVQIDSFQAKYGQQGGSRGLPLYLTVEANVVSRGDSLEVGAASAGPDRTWNTDDDITSWSKK